MTLDNVEITRLTMGSGDVLLVRVPDHYNHAHIYAMVQQALHRVGINASVIVGPKDIEFQIMRPQKSINATKCSDGTFRTAKDRAAFEAAT